jgi:hypothetical protein
MEFVQLIANMTPYSERGDAEDALSVMNQLIPKAQQLLSFEPNEHHRAVLRARSGMGKMGVPRHQAQIKPEHLRAVVDLSAAGLIKCVDAGAVLFGMLVDIYQTTELGDYVCMKFNIEAKSP